MMDRKVTLKKHPNAKRRCRWWVYYANTEAKRISKFLDTRAEAEVYAETIKIQLKKFGLSALTLSDSTRRDAQHALEVLSAYSKTLTEAALFYVAHLKKTANSCRIEELVEPFLQEKEADGFNPAQLFSFPC